MSLLSTLLAWSTAAAAGDDLKHAFTADDIARLLTEKGHAHQIERDSAGDPIIKAVNPLIGHAYQVLFYNCDKDTRACETIQFRAWFTHTQPIAPELVNAWNSERTYGRVFLDTDGDPNIDRFVYAHTGAPTAYVRSELTYFLKVMRDLHDLLADSIE